MIQYIVVVRLSIIALVEEVNEYISHGWTLYGSIAATVDTSTGVCEYLQPMIKV